MNSSFCIKTLQRNSQGIFSYVKDLPKITEEALRKCETILERDIIQKDISKEMLHKMDTLSNECCKIYDSSVVMRNAFLSPTYEEHKRPDYEDLVGTIDKVTSRIGSFFTQLNTNEDLYKKISQAKEPEFWDTLDRGEKSFVNQMIKELTPYQTGHTGHLDQIQRVIDDLTRKFIMNQYNQSYTIKLTKKELKSVSPTLRRYLESLQGKDAAEYELTGDKSILQFILHSPSEEIRKKYFIAQAEANKENIPLMLQILYSRLKKAKILGYKNSYELMKEDKGFMIEDPITALENARKYVKTSSINSVYFKKQLETVLMANDDKLAHIQHLFSVDNVLKGVLFMITEIFGANTKVFLVKVKHSGEIEEKLIKETYTDPAKAGIDITDEIEIPNDPNTATLFRIDLDYNGAHSEIYLDLFERNHKSNGRAATFTIQGSCSKCDGDHQHPIAYMINSVSLEQPFLTFQQIRDVFHELGHAMHIALCKTEFQLINGARVPIDFAEVPSNFTENYVFDYNFISKWLIDHEGKPIDKESFDKIIFKERAAEMMELQETFYFSLMDLYLHNLDEKDLTEEKLIELHSKALPTGSISDALFSQSDVKEILGDLSNEVDLSQSSSLKLTSESLKLLLRKFDNYEDVYRNILEEIIDEKSVKSTDPIIEEDSKNRGEFDEMIHSSLCLLFSLPNYEASYYTYLIAKPLSVMLHSFQPNKSSRLSPEILEIYEQGGEYDIQELPKKIF
ncbi:unnamed protein product [Moneuplotes crassus]|uniref:Peptidase M3A/M3B catalytic domain-containing protein n=1 Tax=Euplotes crassus TaxID=5936 RepID=A0AAD1Y8F1_EUPCR|nr:unnamed protein product [Moneuplotes crassus]